MLDVYWLEEPLHWYLQPADFIRLAAATSIPLAHGERELTRFTVREFIATGAICYVQFDSTRAAGFAEGLRVAALAEQHAVMIAPHTAPPSSGKGPGWLGRNDTSRRPARRRPPRLFEDQIRARRRETRAGRDLGSALSGPSQDA